MYYGKIRSYTECINLDLGIVGSETLRNLITSGRSKYFGYQPRSIRRGRKRPFLIVFDSFGSDRIMAVFHRIVNERKRSDTPFSARLRQLLTVYHTATSGRNTITTKWSIYTP